MIAIIGTTPDDILYFKSMMVIEKEETIGLNIVCYVGKYSQVDAVVVATGHSNMLSSSVTTMVIDKYDPYLIFCVGQVTSIVSNAKQGDIFIAERVYLGNLNMDGFGRVTYSKIPNLPEFFFTKETLIEKILTDVSAVTSRYIIRGCLYSSDVFYTDKSLIIPTISKYFAEGNNIYAFDCETAGVFLASFNKNVPVLCIKVISNEIDNKDQLINFVRKGLEVMPTIGKIITLSLNEHLSDER